MHSEYYCITRNSHKTSPNVLRQTYHPSFLLFIQYTICLHGFWRYLLHAFWWIRWLSVYIKGTFTGQRDFGGIFYSLLSFNALMPFPSFLAATLLWCFWLTAKECRLVTGKVSRAPTQAHSAWQVITLPLQHNQSLLVKGLRSPNPHIIQCFSWDCLQLELTLPES